MHDPRTDLDKDELRLKRETINDRTVLTFITKLGRFSIPVERVPEVIRAMKEVSSS